LRRSRCACRRVVAWGRLLVLTPPAPLALQALLLRGIVTLYAKQLQFLFDDAQLCVAKLQSTLAVASDQGKHTLDAKKQTAKCADPPARASAPRSRARPQARGGAALVRGPGGAGGG